MHNIVLIEKYLPTSIFWSNLIKNKRVEELSVEEILNKYQGFEGELIAFFSVQESELNLNKTIHEYLEMKNSNQYLLLHAISNSEAMAPSLMNQVLRVGYDVGVCEEEKTIYSSIFNEILFGNIDRLIVYKNLLNENLLFPDRVLAEKYVSLHNDLSAQGEGVEDYEEMIIYEIWKHKD